MEQSPEAQIPVEWIIGLFVALMIGSIYLRSKLRERHLRREGQIDTGTGRVPSIEERVAAQKAWSRGEIKSFGRWFMVGAWLVAVVWNLTFGVSFFANLANPSIATGGKLVLGLFALGGIPAALFAIRQTMRYLRFGESICRITGKAGVLGQKIAGSICTKSEIMPEGDYTVMVQCVETYHVGSGKNRRSKTEIHWQGKQEVQSAGTSSRLGIPFSIEIPKYPPETGYQLARGQINWQLSIKAPTKGVDYSAMFIVPVFKVD